MPNQNAVRLGRLGGLARTARKREAARLNGAQGGRPVTAGIRNWVRFFDAVDDARRSRAFIPLEKILRSSRSTREKAVLNATARALAREFGIQPPKWAAAPTWLKDPYFVSNVENLKASALLESPLDFRMNNVFVLENFLIRV